MCICIYVSSPLHNFESMVQLEISCSFYRYAIMKYNFEQLTLLKFIRFVPTCDSGDNAITRKRKKMAKNLSG